MTNICDKIAWIATSGVGVLGVVSYSGLQQFFGTLTIIASSAYALVKLFLIFDVAIQTRKARKEYERGNKNKSK